MVPSSKENIISSKIAFNLNQYLAKELVAWKSENAETLIMILFVQFFKLWVVATSETTLASHVHNEAYPISIKDHLN